MTRSVVIGILLLLQGCSGSDGADGKRGRAGADGQPGAQGVAGPQGIAGPAGPSGPPGVALESVVAPCDVRELDNHDPPVEVLWAEHTWPGVTRPELLVIVGQARWSDGSWTASYAGRSLVTDGCVRVECGPASQPAITEVQLTRVVVP